MTKHSLFCLLGFWLAGLPWMVWQQLPAQPAGGGSAALDQKVQQYLASQSGRWRDLNVPASDGRLLHDLIVKHGYRQALEIGTSTGHSGLWMAWGLSKTGGKLITIEIDAERHRTAVAHFRDAGLESYVDARLGDAHVLVPQLSGPFDFVFSDADKEWYKNYFLAVEKKLLVGGCFTAHNVRDTRGWGGGGWGAQEFLTYIRGLSQYETTVDSSGGGLSISFKKKAAE